MKPDPDLHESWSNIVGLDEQTRLDDPFRADFSGNVRKKMYERIPVVCAGDRDSHPDHEEWMGCSIRAFKRYKTFLEFHTVEEAIEVLRGMHAYRQPGSHRSITWMNAKQRKANARVAQEVREELEVRDIDPSEWSSML